MKQKPINPKYMTTECLKAFRENFYCGKDGLDREQYSEEIDSIYFARTNSRYLREVEEKLKEFEEYQDFLDGICLL